MENSGIYKKCIAALYEKTYGKFEHDDEKAIELFDKLLDEDLQSHCDIVRQFCLDVGYDEHAARKIAEIYDTVSLYKAYKNKTLMYWDLNEFLQG